MGLADLFAGGALRERIAELDEALEQTRVELANAREEGARLKADLAERDGALKASRDQQKRVQKKADKLAGNRSKADRTATDLAARVEELESELGDFRRAMLAAKDDAETQRVGRMEAEKRLANKAATSSAPAQRAPERRERPVNADARVDRLERLLEEIRESERNLKGRLARAEKAARDAERRLSSETGKTDAVLRELQHNLKSERTAYRILQQQFEAQVVQSRGARGATEPKVTAPVPAASHETPTVPPASAEPKKSPLPDGWGGGGSTSSLLAGLGARPKTPAPAEPEPEPVEPVPEPEAEAVAEPEPEPEAQAAAEPEPEAVAAAEPEPAAEPAPEGEAEADAARPVTE